MAIYEYRHETTSPEGFVQHVACNLLPHGYHFFLSGWVPDRKDPLAVDRKLLAKYRIDVSPKTRHRRKLAGEANLHYVRWGHQFLVLAAHGHHDFFAAEAGQIRDVRKVPMPSGGIRSGSSKGSSCGRKVRTIRRWSIRNTGSGCRSADWPFEKSRRNS